MSSTIGWWTLATISESACLVDPGDGRVGAHAAGVRAAVAVEDALVVACGSHREGALAVTQREQRELLACETLLDHGTCVLAETPREEDLLERRLRLLCVLRDGHALAGGQAVDLDDDAARGWDAELSHRRHRLFERGRLAPARGGHAGLLHRALRERLRALELRRRSGGAERRVTLLRERVDEASDERRLGTDDGEIDTLARDRLDDPADVFDADVEQPRIARDPRVARSTQQLGALGRARKRPHDRVLAPPGADDENSQREEMKSSTGIADKVS